MSQNFCFPPDFNFELGILSECIYAFELLLKKEAEKHAEEYDRVYEEQLEKLKKSPEKYCEEFAEQETGRLIELHDNYSNSYPKIFRASIISNK